MTATKAPAIKKRTARTTRKAAAKTVSTPTPARRIRALPSGTYRAVGRRKTAVAMVYLSANGPAAFTINRKPLADYFRSTALQTIALSPLRVVGKDQQFGFAVRVSGGGFQGQAEAIRHGVSRCLLLYDANLRPTLKPLGMLTRDPRMKERKKPGLKRARRAPQWSKR